MFSLYEEAVKLIEESTVADPKDLATILFKMIPPNEMESVVLPLLRSYLSITANQLSALPLKEIENYANQKIVVGASAYSKTPGNGIKSGFAVQMQNWRKKLDENFCAKDGWELRLGDVTREQWVMIAKDRFARAKTSQSHGEEAQRRAEAMEEYGVERFEDLPEDVLIERLKHKVK
jgi:hypothetical protein